MNPLNLIPTHYRILASGMAVALAGLGVFALGWSNGAESVQASWDKARAVQTQAALAAELDARAKEKAMNRKLQEAENAATEREKKLRADYAAAHAAANGLRDTIATIRGGLPSAPAEACHKTANAALAVFSECSEELGRVAEAADGHASDARKLTEAWPD